MRIVVEVDEEFHTLVKIRAARERKAVADIVRDLLRAWLKGEVIGMQMKVIPASRVDAVGPIIEPDHQTRGKA